jgi:deoxycytidylate deaminase
VYEVPAVHPGEEMSVQFTKFTWNAIRAVPFRSGRNQSRLKGGVEKRDFLAGRRLMKKDLVKGIEQAYRERTDLIVFALTGRTGSGCSTAAITLGKKFEEITLSAEDLVPPEKRKFSIVTNYIRRQWIPFKTITVSSVIYTFVLEEEWESIAKLLADLKVSSSAIDEFRNSVTKLRGDPRMAAFARAVLGKGSDEDRIAAWDFFADSIETNASGARKIFGAHYQPVFQRFGDNVRCSGRPPSSTIDTAQLFALMQRVRFLISAAEVKQKKEGGPGARLVVDAIRNPLELVYLRDHFANLYVIAITADDESRRLRLTDAGLGKRDVDRLDEKEYNEKKHLADYPAFVSQNIRDCIQKADVFVANPGKPLDMATSVRAMNVQLVRYVALALRPGLVTPTRDERCMQVAFVAKLNSGCISRQVGAVVADDGYSIQAIGWNDVPKGQVPCLLRDVGDLLTGSDDIAFSDFEKRDAKLRKHLQDKFNARAALKAEGLPCPFCFRDAYNTVTGEKNQVHTRSLHAEENAILQLAKRGTSGIAGGALYTTASPCELCSKKAFQLGIRDVVYVDPYPGISSPHVLASGASDARPRLRLFSGAVGPAYHRLYEALLSMKDEYGARLSSETQQSLVLEP